MGAGQILPFSPTSSAKLAALVLRTNLCLALVKFSASPGEIKSKIHTAAHREKDKGGPSPNMSLCPIQRVGRKGALQRKDKIGNASFPQALPLGSGTWEAGLEIRPEIRRLPLAIQRRFHSRQSVADACHDVTYVCLSPDPHPQALS